MTLASGWPERGANVKHTLNCRGHQSVCPQESDHPGNCVAILVLAILVEPATPLIRA